MYVIVRPNYVYLFANHLAQQFQTTFFFLILIAINLCNRGCFVQLVDSIKNIRQINIGRNNKKLVD